MFDTTFITVPSGSITLGHGSQRESFQLKLKSFSTQLTGKFIHTVQCGIATFLHIHSYTTHSVKKVSYTNLDVANMLTFTFMHQPYLVCILFDMPSLHFFYIFKRNMHANIEVCSTK